MSQWIIFALGSSLLITISWRPLHNPRSHGFYRFFAWEAVLALFLLNARFWFSQPFAWNQLIAWSLLLISLTPLVLGVQSLRTGGKPVDRREGDPSLLAFEKTTTLVMDGIYHYIRHPLYSSLFLLTWGIFFKSPSWYGTVLALLATFLLILTARADESECFHFFGMQYQQYMEKTRMFIPYIF